jgi:hypothetical protein
MISLAAVPFLPHHGAASAMDWTMFAALVLVIAVALVAVYVLDRRPATPRPIRKREISDSKREVA